MIPESAATSRAVLLRAALEYADLGWPVFPLWPGGKNPIIPKCPDAKGLSRDDLVDHARTCSRDGHGHHDATTDPRKIHAWWNCWPNANIGVPTGARSGLLVLDVDHPAGLEALEAERGALPATRTHSTGSGGMHFFFRYPAGENIRNSAGKLAQGLDVRGEGGYVVVPPSVTTRPYEVLDPLPLAEPPAGLLEALRRLQSTRSRAAYGAITAQDGQIGPNKHTRSSLEVAGSFLSASAVSIDTAGPSIHDGLRHDALASIAGRLHDGTRSLDQLTADLEAINEARCVPPIGSDDPGEASDVAKTAASIHRREPCRKSAPPDAETLEALDRIEDAHLWGSEWKGARWKVPRSVFVALIKHLRRHGVLIPAGVRGTISRRALALAASASKKSVDKAIRRLREAGVLRCDNADRSGTEAGAFVLVTPGEAGAQESPTSTHRSAPSVSGGVSGLSLRAPLTAPRLRWTAPRFDRVGDEYVRSTITRMGKTAEQIVDTLERAGGTLSLQDLAAALGAKRPRDLRRRVVSRLEAAGVVECSDDTVAFTGDWLDALNREREIAGEIDALRRDMARYAREREAYQQRDTVRPEPVPERPPDGEIRELERVEPADAELVEALAAYLDRNPRRSGEPPSWLAVALWAEEYLAGKPTPAAVEVALASPELRSVAA